MSEKELKQVLAGITNSHNYAKVGDSTQRTGAERKERCIRF